ncbi:unnamed protein product [Closterium sp. Naga37s-1]|nr:unnamed protein product [Closterium sp. Naga37s-1]
MIWRAAGMRRLLGSSVGGSRVGVALLFVALVVAWTVAYFATAHFTLLTSPSAFALLPAGNATSRAWLQRLQSSLSVLPQQGQPPQPQHEQQENGQQSKEQEQGRQGQQKEQSAGQQSGDGRDVWDKREQKPAKQNDSASHASANELLTQEQQSQQHVGKQVDTASVDTAANDGPVAICLVGGARDFEATWPSILRHVISRYPPAHLFLHSPLDERASKLWALLLASPANATTASSAAAAAAAAATNSTQSAVSTAVSIAAVRIFPSADIAETDQHCAVLTSNGSPHGIQVGHVVWGQHGMCMDGVGSAVLDTRCCWVCCSTFVSWRAVSISYPPTNCSTTSPTAGSSAHESTATGPPPLPPWRMVSGVPSQCLSPPTPLFTSLPSPPSRHTPPSPLSQGLLQYFRLVEGCVDLIATHQQQHNISYRWVIRTRVDGYWTAPPPLLPSLHPSAYTIPFGFDWGGLNDRLGIGSWDASKVALRRLSALQDLFSAGYRALTSEKAFRAQMEAVGVAVARKHFHFCVVTRRRSRGGDGCAAMMFSTATYGPLNGAKCRPCSSPCAVDDQAAAIINTVRAAGGMYRHPLPPGMQLCDAKQAWEGAWERQFDRDVERQRGGKTLSWQRRNIGLVAASLAHCTEQFNKLKAVSVTWDSPPPVAVCIRAQLGEVELMGSKTGEFNTFTSLLTSKRSTGGGEGSTGGGEGSTGGGEESTGGGEESTGGGEESTGGGEESTGGGEESTGGGEESTGGGEESTGGGEEYTRGGEESTGGGEESTGGGEESTGGGEEYTRGGEGSTTRIESLLSVRRTIYHSS